MLLKIFRELQIKYPLKEIEAGLIPSDSQQSRDKVSLLRELDEHVKPILFRRINDLYVVEEMELFSNFSLATKVLEIGKDENGVTKLNVSSEYWLHIDIFTKIFLTRQHLVHVTLDISEGGWAVDAFISKKTIKGDEICKFIKTEFFNWFEDTKNIQWEVVPISY